MAVGGDPEARHGIVLTADYIAKKYGVKTGMARWQAKQVKGGHKVAQACRKSRKTNTKKEIILKKWE